MSTTSTPPATTSTPTHVLATWALLAAVTAALNLVVWGVADLAGAALVAEQAGTPTDIVWAAVIAATAVALLIASVVYAIASPRLAWVGRIWAPVVVVLGLASLVGLTGAADAGTAIALGVMHVLVTAVAAFALPARLGRR